MIDREWSTLVAEVQAGARASGSLTDGYPTDVSEWGSKAYWREQREPGGTVYEGQCTAAVSLTNTLKDCKMPVPPALERFLPGARAYLAERERQLEAEQRFDDEQAAEQAKRSARSERPRRESQRETPAEKPKRERFWLPNRIFEVDVTPYTLKLYLYLARRAGKSGICWPSQDTIVRECRMNPKTITRAVRDLRRAKMLAVQRGSFGRSSKYRLTDPSLWAHNDTA